MSEHDDAYVNAMLMVIMQANTWSVTSRVAQVAYYAKPKDPKRHVVVSGKQTIVGVDGVQSPEEHNHYAEFSLFTDHPRKIKQVKNRLTKSGM